MKQATYLSYTDYNFTDWSARLGAEKNTWIAFDAQENKLLKTWHEAPDLMDVEKELNAIGYTIGL